MENLSMRTISYQFTGHLQSERILAIQVRDLYPNFADEVQPEVKAEFYEGASLRFAENNPQIEQTYVLDVKDGQKWYRPIGVNEKLAKDVNKVHLSVSFVMAESTQKFSSLKETNPALHALCKPVRDAVNKYCSNAMKALQSKVKALNNEGQTRTRGATKSFSETVTDTMLDLKKKCVAAKGRNDESADSKLLGEATVAFMTVWNHKR